MHASPLTAVAACPELNLIASGAYDGKVQMWTESLVPLWSFQAADLVNHVRFSPDGQALAAAAADGFVYVLDSRTGAIRAQLGPHRDDVNAVAWHPQGRLLACVMDAKDARVAVWDVRSGQEQAPLIGHEHGIFALAFDPTGRELVTAAEDGTCRIWDFESRQQRAVLQHPGDPETVDWSPRGDLIASGCDDGVLRVWDARTGALALQSNAATAAVRLVQFSPDGSQLLAGSYEGKLRVHAVPSLKVDKELQAPFQWERTAAFLNGGAMAIGSFGSGPVLHHADGRVEHVQLPSPTFGINTVSAGDGMICVGRDDGTVVNLQDGRALYHHPSIINTVVIGPQGLIGSGDYRGNLKLYDRKLGKVVAQTELVSGPINTIAFLPDGSGLFTSGYDGVIRQWTRELKLLKEWTAHHGPVKSLAWSAVSQVLIAGSSDDTVTCWRDGEKLCHIEDDALVLINGVAASPVAPHFATASRDCTVRIWHAETGALIDALPPGHIKSVKAIAYSPDGRRILTGAYDGFGILWQKAPDGGWQMHRLALHGKPGVPAVTFDGDAALTAGWDGTVGRWSASGELLAQYRASSLHREGAMAHMDARMNLQGDQA
jgi:WD40 repeat protein